MPADPNPIVACRAPNATEQLQCYCTTATCGAGMLDAGAAVRAATGARVAITAAPTVPTAGQAVTLSGSGSTVAPGRSIVGWQWSVVDVGSTGSVFSGSTNAANATLLPATAGTVTVQLIVTDDLGIAVASPQTLTIAAAAVPPPPAAAGSGGGALGWAWLAWLALLTAALATCRPTRLQR